MDNFGPVLRGSTKAANSTKLRLAVNKAWRPQRMVDRVPWPPPARSTTLAPYLFLFGADVRPMSTTGISRSTLYRLLGTHPGTPTHRARDLKRALAGVNAHLAKLGSTISFEMEETDPGRVRFTTPSEIRFDDVVDDGPEQDVWNGRASTQVHVDEYAEAEWRDADDDGDDDFEQEEIEDGVYKTGKRRL